MRHKHILLTLTSLICLVTTLGCQGQPTPTPTQVQEPDIPANFTTYTEEGLFSISYPSDWRPAKSMMEEIWEARKRELMTVAPTASIEGMGFIFLAGKESSEGYYPTVNIITDRRSIGYWTLDEVYEANDLACIEYMPGYKVLSTNRVTVDCRDAIIDVYEDNAPGLGRWRYTGLCTVEGNFAWLVTCACEYQDFDEYKDVFQSIVRSLRILN